MPGPAYGFAPSPRTLNLASFSVGCTIRTSRWVLTASSRAAKPWPSMESVCDANDTVACPSSPSAEDKTEPGKHVNLTPQLNRERSRFAASLRRNLPVKSRCRGSDRGCAHESFLPSVGWPLFRVAELSELASGVAAVRRSARGRHRDSARPLGRIAECARRRPGEIGKAGSLREQQQPGGQAALPEIPGPGIQTSSQSDPRYSTAESHSFSLGSASSKAGPQLRIGHERVAEDGILPPASTENHRSEAGQNRLSIRRFAYNAFRASLRKPKRFGFRD